MKVQSLQDLKIVRKALAERRERATALEAARREAARRAEAEANLFRRAAGTVQPLKAPTRVLMPPVPVAPIPVQSQIDEQRVLHESLSDEFDASTLLDVDDALSYRRSGVGTDVTRKLRRGDWAIQREIDLHGLRRDEAREALSAHIREALRRGHRCVRVVHGKGHGSPGRQPVLKAKVQRWLGQSAEVAAFAQASGPQGGAGALIVLLTG